VTKPGSVNRDMVSNLDFAATFLEAANLENPGDLHGKSLRPLLAGETPADWRKAFYYHYYEHPGPHSVARHYGVVTDRFKLVHFYDPNYNYTELFDLRSDPRELKDVFADSAYAEDRRRLQTMLANLRTELKVPNPDPAESAIKAAPANKKKAGKKQKAGADAS
jgi:arylsulfatase A-like enzyme